MVTGAAPAALHARIFWSALDEPQRLHFVESFPHTGDGCTIAGVWKAFYEMKTLVLIARTPKMLGVQAAGAAPVTTAFLPGSR